MTRTRIRAGGRHTATLLAAFLVIVFGASPAMAHGGLERSDPPHGGVVAVGRSALTLWFTEGIVLGASTFDLHTSDAVRVAVTVTASDADSGSVVRIRTDRLAKATYVLDWRVLSLEDGHSSSGSVRFGVGTRPAYVASASSGLPEAPEILLRWLDLSAIMLAIGALAVSGRVFGSMGEVGNSPRRRSRVIGALAAGVAVVSGAVTPLLLTQAGGSSRGLWLDVTWDILTGTPWGHLWLAREIALMIAAGALCWWGSRRLGSRGRVQVAVVALLAAVCLEAWAGHASTLPDRSGFAAFASACHLLAAGVWAGGLATLVICLFPTMRKNPDLRGPILASAWRSFSPMAAIATVVLLATGLYESGRHVPDLRSVTSTVYGAAVVGKTVMVAVALVLAAINTLLVNPPLAAPARRILGWPVGSPVPLRRFTTVVVAEVLILIVAVGTASLLTSVPTAREIGTALRQTTVHTADVDGLFVTFEEVPAGPDQSRLIVRARSTHKLQPAPVSGVSVLLAGPTGTTTSLALERLEPGRYEADTAKPAPGSWTASVALQRDGLPVAVTQIRWTASVPSPEGVRPLEAVTTGLAVLLLTATLGAVGFTRRRRRRAVRSIPLVRDLVMREKTGSHP